MTNQAESNSRRIVAHYSPPAPVILYGPHFEVIEQDGYRPAEQDDSDESFPLRDWYDPPLAHTHTHTHTYIHTHTRCRPATGRWTSNELRLS
jgi:hypothetical protein